MSNYTTAAKKFGGFMKRNAMYFLIVLCIASIATVIALAVTGNFGGTDVLPASVITDPDITVDKPDEPDTPVIKPDEPVVKPLTFCAPASGDVTKSYSDAVLVWSSTLSEYSTHLGTDFVSKDLSVFAVAAGTVKEVGFDTLEGYYVTVSHDENYESRYYSLAEAVKVKKGDKVIEGQLLGTMSNSMATESLDGNHLHFEMSKNGADINPLEVIILDEK